MMRWVWAIGLAALAGCDRPPDAPAANVAAPASAPAPAASATPAASPTERLPSGVRLVGSDNQYDVILPTDILFDFDKATLRPEAEPMLVAVRELIDRRGADQLHVRGYTDAKGSDQYNFRLSFRRAGAVCDWLKAHGARTTNCIGRGEQDPIAPNAKPDRSDDPDGRQQNRRVTISVIKYPDVNAMLDKARAQAGGRN